MVQPHAILGSGAKESHPPQTAVAWELSSVFPLNVYAPPTLPLAHALARPNAVRSILMSLETDTLAA